MNTSSIRTRWAAIGAAIAVSLGAGGIGIGHATTSSGERPVFIPIDPCRLADIRPDTIGPDGSRDFDGWGATGDCTLPTGTSGLALNVTAVGATQQTNLRFHPQGTPTPETANLNPTPGAPPTPNAVNVSLNDANGKFTVFNRFGNVAVVIDVMGYYDDHNHDDRYYTETETDATFATKTELDDKADAADVYTKAETALTMFARAQQDGTQIAGTTGVTTTKAGVGRYVVRFPVDVTECALVAQNNLNLADVASELVYLYTTTPTDPNDVFVYFENEAGDAEDREFSVIVTC